MIFSNVPKQQSQIFCCCCGKSITRFRALKVLIDELKLLETFNLNKKLKCNLLTQFLKKSCVVSICFLYSGVYTML